MQVLVVIDARPNVKIQAISHKQFVEHVGVSDVPDRYRYLLLVTYQAVFRIRIQIQGVFWIRFRNRNLDPDPGASKKVKMLIIMI